MTTTVSFRGPIAHVRGSGNRGSRLSMQRVDGVAYSWAGRRGFCYGVPADVLPLSLLSIDGASLVLLESDTGRALRFDHFGSSVTVWAHDACIIVDADDFMRAAVRARMAPGT